MGYRIMTTFDTVICLVIEFFSYKPMTRGTWHYYRRGLLTNFDRRAAEIWLNDKHEWCLVQGWASCLRASTNAYKWSSGDEILRRSVRSLNSNEWSTTIAINAQSSASIRNSYFCICVPLNPHAKARSFVIPFNSGMPAKRQRSKRSPISHPE